jgi:hypothetical protein
MRDEKGFVSVLLVFMVCFTLPFFLFHMVEMNYLYGSKDKFQNFNDAAAVAAVMQMDEEYLKDGTINVVEAEAKKIVERILAENYGLDDNLLPKSNSYIKNKPVIKVYVVNPDMQMDFAIDEGFTYTVKNPTVVVYTEAKPKGIFFDKFVTIKSLSAYEVSFKTGRGAKITNDPLTTSDGLILTMKHVINPLSFSKNSDLLPIDWQFSSLPMAAGGNIEFTLKSTKANVNLDSASYDLKVVGERYDRKVTGTMEKISNRELTTSVQIPADAPIGSVITLDFKDSKIILSINGGTVQKGNSALGFKSDGESIGEVEANLFKLIRFQKAYPN